MAAIGGVRSVVTDGLVWHIDSANIQSRNSSGGTVYNTVSYSTSTPSNLYGAASGVSWQPQTPFARWLFDGTDDSISFDGQDICNRLGVYSGTDNNVPYTQEAWFARSGTPSGTGLNGYSIAGHASSGGIGLQLHNNGSGVVVNVGFRSNSNKNSTQYIDFQKWYHVAYTMDGGATPRVRIYINGEKDSEHSASNLLVVDYTTADFQVGDADTRIGHHLGNIVYTSVYNRQLSDAEIRQNFLAGKRRFELTTALSTLSWV